MIDYKFVLGVKAAVALAGTLLLSWDLYTRRHPRSRLAGPRLALWRTAALALCGVLAFMGWWNFGAFHYTGEYVHNHEFIHYYLGAKYQRELGYTRLYGCLTSVDVEAGMADDVAQGWVRNLTTNRLEPGTDYLADIGGCRARFSDDRWRAFTADVAWMRGRVSARKWRSVTMDHGFNATPVWMIAGTLLSNLGPASNASILSLALIDVFLLGAMWLMVLHAFGWRTTVVALLWWGCNYPARFLWNGGAFLRMDWLFLMVASLCLARERYAAASGFALAWSALLRVFPGFLGVGLLLSEASSMWRRRTWVPSPDARRFVLGGVLALALLVPLSSWVTSGRALDVETWRGFVANSEKHFLTPSSNNVGLRAALAFDPATRIDQTQNLWFDGPWDVWRAARLRTLGQRRWIFWLAVVVFLVLLARAVADRPLWLALTLGATFIPVGTELTCYYYAGLLVIGFLSEARPWIGPATSGLAVFSCLVPVAFGSDDVIYAVTTVAIVGIVVLVAVSFGRRSSSVLAAPARDVPPAGSSQPVGMSAIE